VIPGGAAGDRFGRKGVLLAGLALFAAGGLMSALAPNVPLLLASRAITGAVAAAVLPNTLAVLLHAVPDGRKNATVDLGPDDRHRRGGRQRRRRGGPGGRVMALAVRRRRAGRADPGGARGAHRTGFATS
jgi:MFS family permease